MVNTRNMDKAMTATPADRTNCDVQQPISVLESTSAVDNSSALTSTTADHPFSISTISTYVSSPSIHAQSSCSGYTPTSGGGLPRFGTSFLNSSPFNVNFSDFAYRMPVFAASHNYIRDRPCANENAMENMCQVASSMSFNTLPPVFNSTNNLYPTGHYAQAVTTPAICSLSHPMPTVPTTSAFTAPTAPIFAQPASMSTTFGNHSSSQLPMMITSAFNHADNINLSSSQIASRQVISKDLPVFSGHPEEWPVFITNFEQSTQRCGFNNQENLIRLQKSLKGVALEAVRGKLMLPTMVPHVIATLRMLYGRPDIIHQSLQTKLRQTPAVSANNLSTLINLALALQNYRSTMHAIGLAAYLNDPTLLNELISKLTPELRLEWGKQRVLLGNVNREHFDDWLFNYATYASQVVPYEPITADTAISKQTGNSRRKEQVFIHNVARKNGKYICPKCENDHSLRECSEFRSLSRKDRWSLVREKRLCVCCFENHYVQRCPAKRECGVDGCKVNHNPLLHSDNSTRALYNATNNNSNADADAAAILFHSNIGALFRYVPVVLYGRNKKVETYAIIDEGAACSLIDAGLASKLGLDGPEEELCLKWTGDITQNELGSKRVSLKISSRENNAPHYVLKGVRTMRNLDFPEQTLDQRILQQRRHLCGLPILPYYNVKAQVLIGLDNMKIGIPLECYESESDDLMGTRCRLGWSAYGRQHTNGHERHSILHVCNCGATYSEQRLDELMKEHFSIETIGIKVTSLLRSKEDERALNIMEKTSRYLPEEKRWEVGLLWRFDKIIMPDSYSMAVRRLHCLESKMDKDAQLKTFLVETIQNHEKKGYIRQISAEDRIYEENSWYIPIFTVTNPNKKKVRLVWDAAAKVNDLSLNSFLMKGPDLLASLPGILIRFRERRFAISGDIREMFHQVKVRNEDQAAQKFLWRDGNREITPRTYVMQVMTFGASCSPSLANFVKNKNADRFINKYPTAVAAIHTNTFVDDWLQATDTEENMIELANTVKWIHQEGGFDMRNWSSNSNEVLQSLASPGSNPVDMQFDESNPVKEKILGMWWLPQSDEIVFTLNVDPWVMQSEVKITKRQMLRTVMKIFDPLGLLGFFTIGAKIILQNVWRSRISWDNPVEEIEQSDWFGWMQLLPQVKQIKIPRSFRISNETTNIELHTFVDASLNAYAAVTYFRVIEHQEICCHLVASKTRVAPLKPISVPRLELMAAVLGLRLSRFIVKEASVQVKRRVFWSDSKDVLFWIHSDARKFPQFVSLRIGEILEDSDPYEWRWVPSRMNVADAGTKFDPKAQINSTWFTGPAFLSLPETEWPESRLTTKNIVMHLSELNVNMALGTLMPDVTRFSKWEKLRATQHYVLIFLLKITRKRKVNTTVEFLRTLVNMNDAELFLMRCCQEEVFVNEIISLKKAEEINRSSVLYNYSPYLDPMGLIRVKGRIDMVANTPLDVKRPIILPRKHNVTNLIVDYYHRRFYHHHNEIVVNEMRQRFAIPGLRALVRDISKRCQLCRNRKASPQPPEMGNLPRERLQPFSRPFSFTGVDYFGPIDVIVGRRREKRYGVLFTCLVMRAVHIEIAPSLSTDSFLLVFKQFISRRGMPSRIVSDNATNFRGASRILLEEIEKKSNLEIEQKYPEIDWKFIPPASPHMGGSWERMVRSVKSILTEVLPETGVREDVLRATLADIENIINSRPLTYVPLDSPEDAAITPNMLLNGTTGGWHERSTFDDSGNALNKYFRISTQLSDRFWKRWVRECLPEMTRRSKWFKSIDPLAVNDVVIVVDDQTKRNTWVKGVVVDVCRASDGQVRSAVIKTKHGLMTRPAVKLAKLEVGKPHSNSV